MRGATCSEDSSADFRCAPRTETRSVLSPSGRRGQNFSAQYLGGSRVNTLSCLCRLRPVCVLTFHEPWKLATTSIRRTTGASACVGKDPGERIECISDFNESKIESRRVRTEESKGRKHQDHLAEKGYGSMTRDWCDKIQNFEHVPSNTIHLGTSGDENPYSKS